VLDGCGRGARPSVPRGGTEWARRGKGTEDLVFYAVKGSDLWSQVFQRAALSDAAKVMRVCILMS